MASVKKDLPKSDELAQTGESLAETPPPAAAAEIPTRAAKRAGGTSAFTVTALGSVKHEGKFFGPGSTLELTDEQAADFGAHVEPKK